MNAYIPDEEYRRMQAVLPILCVDTVILHAGRCLLARRLNHPARGQYWFPGGRLHKNERIVDGARRKSLEETRLICEYQAILSVEETIFPQVEEMVSDAHTVNICCLMTPKNPNDIALERQHDVWVWADWEMAQTLSLHNGVLHPLRLALLWASK